jgi:hypothetical protein
LNNCITGSLILIGWEVDGRTSNFGCRAASFPGTKGESTSTTPAIARKLEMVLFVEGDDVDPTRILEHLIRHFDVSGRDAIIDPCREDEIA